MEVDDTYINCIRILGLKGDKATLFETIEMGLYPGTRYVDNPSYHDKQSEQLSWRKHLKDFNWPQWAKRVNRRWKDLGPAPAKKQLLEWYRDCLRKARHKLKKQQQKGCRTRHFLKGEQLALFDITPFTQHTQQSLQKLTLVKLQAMAAQRYGGERFALSKAGQFAQLGENPLYRKAPWIRLLLAPTDPTDLIRAARHESNVIDICDRFARGEMGIV